MAKTFDGKVVVVTGANSGIGEGAAVAFVEAGAKVYGIVRRTEALEASRKRHPSIQWILADVSVSGQAAAAISKVASEAKHLDVLVNNAAVFAPGALGDSTEPDIRRQFDINVVGLILASQAAIPALTQSKGHILNLSSAAGHKAMPGASVYAATKAAVESLTRSWAAELAPLGIRVNALAPGPTESGVFEKLGIPAEMLPGVKASFTKQVPLGRMASTSEIARWVLQLTEPSVTFLTGQVLSVDGGMSL